jgi:hypothetical protein
VPALDTLALVHLGRVRTAPPATGAEPQRDGKLRAHVGRLVLLTGSEPGDDDVFCVTLEDDDTFKVALVDDAVFCVSLERDDVFRIATLDDGTFCVLLVDDDEVQI